MAFTRRSGCHRSCDETFFQTSMSQLHQINLSFNPEQDRLLLSLKTTALEELRFWLTRRFVKQVWPLLLQLLEREVEVMTPTAAPESKKEVLAFQHQQALAESNFGEQYEQRTASRPLGDEPVLVARFVAKQPAPGQHVLSFLPAQGQGIDIRMDNRLLHSFCKLLADTQAKTEWDLQLTLPTHAVPSEPQPSSQLLN